MRSPRTAALAAALALALLAGACAGGESSDVPDAPPGAVPGGTIRVAIDKPGSVDPSNVYEPNGELIVRAMCDPLIQLDPRTGELKPGLAEGWQISDRGSKFVIRLRKGLEFSNGERVTADDVVFTLTRIASVEFASLAADKMSLVKGYEVVHGIEESSNPDKLSKLEGLKVIDSRSFEMKLRKDANRRTDLSMADYLRVLADPVTTPVPRVLAENDPDAFSASPVCSGPYQLAEPWSPEQTTIRLVRSQHTTPGNEGYTRGGEGYADTIEFNVVGGLKEQQAAFEAGKVDVASVGVEALDALRGSRAEQLIVGPSPAIDFVGVSANPQSLWGDTAVRVALSQAIDRDRIVEELYAGGRLPATGFLPPTLGGEIHRDDACATVPASGDVEAAQATLAKAGIDLTGVELPFAFNDEFGNEALVTAVAEQWQEAFGLVVQPQPLAWEEYQRTIGGSAGFPGAFRMSWSPNYPGPDQYVGPLFTSGASAQGNLSHYSDVVFDTRLSREVRRANEPDDLYVEYQRVEDELCDVMPMIPVTYGGSRYLVDTERFDSASGSYLELSTGFVNLRELYQKGGQAG